MVGRRPPFQNTAESWAKFDPFTVNVNCGEPGAIEAGLNVEINGPEAVVMGNARAFDVPALGLLTLTLAVPAVVSKLLATVAVNCVGLMKVVGNS